MKVLLILAGILLALLLLTLLYVKLYVKYEGEEVTLSVGVLFFRYQLLPQKEKKAKKEKKTKKIKKAKAKAKPKPQSTAPHRAADTAAGKKAVTEAEPTPSEQGKAASEQEGSAQKPKKSKTDLKETLTMIYDILRAVIRPTGLILRNIKIADLRLDVVVGGEEPDETAIRFGRWNAAVYGGLAALRNLIDIRCKKVMIAVDFTEPETKLSAGGIIKVRIFVLLIAAARMICRFLVNTLKKEKETETAVQTA